VPCQLLCQCSYGTKKANENVRENKQNETETNLILFTFVIPCLFLYIFSVTYVNIVFYCAIFYNNGYLTSILDNFPANIQFRFIY
jgi:amino acid permease